MPGKNSKYPPESVAPGGAAALQSHAGPRQKLNAWIRRGSLRLLTLMSFLHKVGMDQDIRWTRQLGARILRVLVLAGMSSSTNQIPVRASALTYTSMLTFVPFMVILSSVAGRFGYLDLLSRLLLSLNDSLSLDLNLDPILAVIKSAEKVDFHRLGVVGSLGLLFTFFLSMSNIELAVDHIWDIRKKRNWWRRIVEYTPFLFLVVLQIWAAGNMLLRYRAFLESKLAGYSPPAIVHGTIFLIGNISMIVSAWLALWLLFFIIPNTRVRYFPAALGATVSTVGVYGLSRVLILFPKLLISRNNYIWGSFAAIPAVLLLVYLFWVIVLYGAAVAFIYQRLYQSRERPQAGPATSQAFHAMEERVLAALRAVHALSGTDAVARRKGVPLETLARKLGWDAALAEVMAYPLVDLGLLAKRRVHAGPVYVPRGSLSLVDLTAVHNLLLRLDPEGTGELRALTAFDELKHTLGILYSTGKRNPPLYLSAAMEPGEAGRKGGGHGRGGPVTPA